MVHIGFFLSHSKFNNWQHLKPQIAAQVRFVVSLDAALCRFLLLGGRHEQWIAPQCHDIFCPSRFQSSLKQAEQIGPYISHDVFAHLLLPLLLSLPCLRLDFHHVVPDLFCPYLLRFYQHCGNESAPFADSWGWLWFWSLLGQCMAACLGFAGQKLSQKRRRSQQDTTYPQKIPLLKQHGNSKKN